MLKESSLCLGYQQLTSLSSAAGLTVPSVDPVTGIKIQPTRCIVIAETQAVRWRDDGTAPTASVGMPVAAGQPMSYDGDLTKIKFIEQTASAKLNVSYYA